MSRNDEEVFVLLPDGVTLGSLGAPGTPRLPVSNVPVPPARPRAAPAPAAAGRSVPLPLVSGLLVTALLLGTLAWGWTYYRLPLEARPLHAKHDALRSSGAVGLSLAVAGTTLMLLNLGYLLRKWIPWLHRAGSLRGWMDFHVFTGLLGPAMIVLHSGLRLTSVLGTLSFAAMLVVVCAGVIGRYIYSRVPRTIAGHELELEEVRLRLGELERQLARYGIDARRLAGAAGSARAAETAPSRGILASLASLAAGDRALRRQMRRHRAAILASPGARRHARTVLPLLRGVAREGQWLARYHELRTLMRSWRFLHRWLALLMLMLAAFHIGVAIRFGDLWVFP